MKNNVVETVVGAVVIVVAAVFLTIVYQTSDVRVGTGGYELKANFESIDGISTGSDVRISGIKIGSVIDQFLNGESYEAVVTMSIAPEVKLPLDSSAKVTSDGLLGSKFIALEPGGDENMLGAGDTIDHTQGSIDIFGLISKFLFADDDKKSE